MIAEFQVADPDNDVQMTNARVVVNLAFASVNYAEPNSHPPPDSIAKEPPVTRPLKKRRQHRDTPEREQPKFAGSMHLVSRPLMPAHAASRSSSRFAQCRAKFVGLGR